MKNNLIKFRYGMIRKWHNIILKLLWRNIFIPKRFYLVNIVFIQSKLREKNQFNIENALQNMEMVQRVSRSKVNREVVLIQISFIISLFC